MRSSPFFVFHDLTHYSVETALGCTDAFFGLLAQGWEITSFQERQPGSRKVRQTPPQALMAERIVGLLDTERLSGATSHPDFIAYLREKAAGMGMRPLEPTEVDLDRIRTRIREIFAAFKSLKPGETLELQFPIPSIAESGLGSQH
jgi:hypothetical protein